MVRRVAAVIVHSAVAVTACMILGFVPEALLDQMVYGTRLEPLMPGFTVVSILLGFFVARKIAEPEPAKWIWVPWLFWLSVGFGEVAGHWSPAWDVHPSRWSYAFENLFGTTPNCGATECLYEVFFTAPFLCAAFYSIGAAIALKASRRSHLPTN